MLTINELAEHKQIPVEILKDVFHLSESIFGVRIPYLPGGRTRIRTSLVAREGSRWDVREPDKPITPYGVHQMLRYAREKGQLVLCEGESDIWAAYTLDLIRQPTTVGFLGIPGASMVGSTLQAEHLTNVRHLLVLDEKDDGAKTFINGVARRLNELQYAGKAYRLVLPGNIKDIADLVVNFTTEEAQKIFKEAFFDALTLAKYKIDLTAHSPGEQSTASKPDPFTDLANSLEFAFMHENKLRFSSGYNRWLIYDDGVWRFDDSMTHLQYAQKFIAHLRKKLHSRALPDEQVTRWLRRSASHERIKAMLNLAKPHMHVTPEQLDRDPYILNLKNGEIDLRTFEVRQHDPLSFLSRQCRAEYDPGALCPTWEWFLEDIFPGDPETVEFLRRCVGYTLTGDVSEQALFILYGTGHNGKSTFVNTIQTLLGTYAAKIRARSLLDTNSECPEDIARLKGLRMGCATEAAGKLNAELVKELTSYERIAARYLYGHIFEFTPTAKLWISTNHKPDLARQYEKALWNRLYLIPFSIDVYGRRDRKLPDKLIKELPGILNWALQGLKEYYLVGLKPSKTVLYATEEYRADTEPITRFIAEKCIVDEDASVPNKDLYKAYRAWCDDNKEYALSHTKFAITLKEMGYQQARNRRTRYWYGLYLREDTFTIERERLPF